MATPEQLAAWAANRERVARLKAEAKAEKERLKNLSPEEKAKLREQKRIERQRQQRETRAFMRELERERKAREADPRYQLEQLRAQAELKKRLAGLDRIPYADEIPDRFKDK